MAMTRKDFVMLADMIIEFNSSSIVPYKDGMHRVSFSYPHLLCLAEFCRRSNPIFDEEHWMEYIRKGSIDK